LVGRREQRLAGHDIDIDARFLVIQIFSASGGLGAVLLRYVILLGRELSNCVVVFTELSHLFSPYRRHTKVFPFSITLARGAELWMTISIEWTRKHSLPSERLRPLSASTATVQVMNVVGIIRSFEKLKGWDLPPADVDQPTKIIFSWKGDEP